MQVSQAAMPSVSLPAVSEWSKLDDKTNVTTKSVGMLGFFKTLFSVKSATQKSLAALQQVRASIKEAYPKLADEHVDAHFEMVFHTEKGLQETLPTGKQLKDLKKSLDAVSYTKLGVGVNKLLEEHPITPENINAPGDSWDDSSIYQLKNKLTELLKKNPPISSSSHASPASVMHGKLQDQIAALTDKLANVFNDMQQTPSRSENMSPTQKKELVESIDPFVKAIQNTLAEKAGTASEIT